MGKRAQRAAEPRQARLRAAKASRRCWRSAEGARPRAARAPARSLTGLTGMPLSGPRPLAVPAPRARLGPCARARSASTAWPPRPRLHRRSPPIRGHIHPSTRAPAKLRSSPQFLGKGGHQAPRLAAKASRRCWRSAEGARPRAARRARRLSRMTPVSTLTELLPPEALLVIERVLHQRVDLHLAPLDGRERGCVDVEHALISLIREARAPTRSAARRSRRPPSPDCRSRWAPCGL